VVALRGALATDADLPLPEDAARFLTPEDWGALEALGRDLVAGLMRGEVRRKRRRPRRGRDRVGGSFQCGGTGILTDKARAEMERKLRELEAREREASGAEWVEDSGGSGRSRVG
jgi:hypothetical protein